MKKKFAQAFGRKGAGILLAGLLAVTAAANMLPVKAAEPAGSVGLNVAYHTQQEILDRMNSDAAVISAGITYSEDPAAQAPYAMGSLSQETLDGAVTMLNQVRYIAGLQDNVTLDDEFNRLAQAGSLVNYVNHQLTQRPALSHTPAQPSDMENDLYQMGYNGASSSNIAWASWANRSLQETLVQGWMNDGDDYNIARVGHRRWCLNPAMGKTGFGAVTGSNGTYSAMYSVDGSNSGATETAVAWPAQNMPVKYFDTDYPWSVSMGSPVDAASVTVTLARVSDGATWTFSSNSADGYFNVNNDYCGQLGCIIFRPDNVEYSAGDSFQVTIEGLGSPIFYRVNFFDENTCGSNENLGNSGDNGDTGDNGGDTGDNGGSTGDNGGDTGDNGGSTGDNGGSTGDNGSGNTGSNGNDSAPSASEPDNGSTSGYDLGMQIADAKSGDTIKMTGVTTLSNGEMKELLKKDNVTLIMEYTYQGVNYVVTIPSKAAVDNDIPWYGPLYLSAHYGQGAPVKSGTGSDYTVQARDTMSRIARANGMTLAQLAAKNPQIKDLNRIYVGQRINLK